MGQETLWQGILREGSMVQQNTGSWDRSRRTTGQENSGAEISGAGISKAGIRETGNRVAGELWCRRIAG